jgi:alkaline phosphatase D
MKRMSRREFLAMAASIGAVATFARADLASAAPSIRAANQRWRERRDLFPEGVASGDPDASSVLLWTRRPGAADASMPLTCEVADDAGFERIIATAHAKVTVASDWTCRVLVGGLKPAHEYWYRFTDEHGNGSRIGRTLTAPADDDARPVRFAFVSCQNMNYGAQNAYRRMIFEDQKAAAEDRLGFVLHLGDFIYELVWYPEERPQGMYDRKLRDIVRYPHGEKHADFHIPTTVEDYRAVYRAYLHDPDLQDARAHFPFVPIWDNHEFSWLGWQSLQKFDGKTTPQQRRKVAANQAWFEYLPARIRKPKSGLERFDGPHVSDAAIAKFDQHGLGSEPNNLAAIGSLTGYRALRWGEHVDLIITDQRSYRSEDPFGREEANAFSPKGFPQFADEDAQRVVDAGRTCNGGKPPATIRIGEDDVPNYAKDSPPQTILGAEQKQWFLERLKASRATWKIWGNTIGTLDTRADPQNLPSGITPRWSGPAYASLGGGDFGSAYVEREQIYDFIAQHAITGFAIVAGDRHSFWAGLAAKDLSPRTFAPVGVAFITGSVSAPGMVESLEHKFPKADPLRALFLADREGRTDAAINLLLHHGVRTCFEYAHSGDIVKAKALSNAQLAPHVAFVDMGGHGYSVVRASTDALEVEFVCIPRPIERSAGNDGGPLRYRVAHRAARWTAGETPKLERRVIEGDVDLMT